MAVLWVGWSGTHHFDGIGQRGVHQLVSDGGRLVGQWQDGSSSPDKLNDTLHNKIALPDNAILPCRVWLNSSGLDECCSVARNKQQIF